MPFAFLRRRPLVSICIPAYQSQAFIAKTLDSALAQTVQDIEIIVSNDGAHPTPDLDTRRTHPKLRVIDQPDRLGWVANTNTVMSAARGHYFMILPHDDILHPDYLQACLEVLHSDPAAFAVTSDIDTPQGTLTCSEARGPLQDRITHIMRHLYNGYHYRAMMPRRAHTLGQLHLMRNPPVNFACDTVWMIQQACFGELRRVPRPLYHKSDQIGSARIPWRKLSPDALRACWMNHCRLMSRCAALHLQDKSLLHRLEAHRQDARNVREAPSYVQDVML